MFMRSRFTLLVQSDEPVNLLSGELRATSGRITFRGENVTSAPPDRLSRLGIGRSYQTANVFPAISP